MSKRNDRAVYHHGKKGVKYGIWNNMAKKFQFGICEDTPMLAEARLYQKIGDDARQWRFQAKPIPQDMLVDVASTRTVLKTPKDGETK